MLNDIAFEPGDVVVDVGANIGEIGLWLQARHPGVRYIAFEPSPREFACLTRNADGGETHNCGLWHEAARLTFYVNSEDADSSLLEPARFDQRHEVPCGRLDELVAPRPVKLLKVDAEGAEPEVLLGARRLLPYCQHVVIDAGPERGVDQVATAAEVINTMVGSGFDVVQVEQARLVIAFRKRQSAAALAE
jgi:FkbM family methyltransferase